MKVGLIFREKHPWQGLRVYFHLSPVRARADRIDGRTFHALNALSVELFAGSRVSAASSPGPRPMYSETGSVEQRVALLDLAASVRNGRATLRHLPLPSQ